jgi:outer membrane protein OmpA-like peptidoglycan-associated protein
MGTERLLDGRSALWGAIGLLAMVSLLAGCGGSSHHRSQTTSHVSTDGSTATVVHALATVDDFAAQSDQPDHMRVSIYDLRRSGPFVVLDFGVRCVGASDSCSLEYDFAASSHAQQVSRKYAENGYSTASGVTLVDPLAKQQYLPVVDSQGRPDSSKLSDLDVGSPVMLEWVKFRAPPSSVHALDVLFPEGGPVVAGVPISTGPAPSPSQIGPGVQTATPSDFAYPEASSDTSGLTLPVENLDTIVGSHSGSDSEAADKSTITLNADVLFKFDKSNLTPMARGILQSVAARIKSSASGTVRVTGYTDSIGTDAVNMPLSQARAQSVVAALKPLVGAAPVSFQASGMGSADPVAPNTLPNGADNPAGRALNRRVTIVYAVKAPTPPAAPPASVATSPPQTGAGARTVTLKAKTDYVSTYTISATRLFRTGNLAVLELSATCVSATSSDGCDGEFDLTGTPTAPPISAETGGYPGGEAELDSASGVYLEDPATGTEYIPLYNSDGVPLTADVEPYMPTGTTQPLWVYFPAPPQSVTSLTIVLPTGPTIAGMSISPTPP